MTERLTVARYNCGWGAYCWDCHLWLADCTDKQRAQAAADAHRCQLTVGSLFTGVGGLDLAMEHFGYTTAWMAEPHPPAVAVLEHRFPGVTNLGDVSHVDWENVPPVDALIGGFPCQDISYAGKGAGLKGERSGLWSIYRDAIRHLRPRLVFVENPSALLRRGLDVVVGEMAALGYDTEWACHRASEIGAPHHRDRCWIVASNPAGFGQPPRPGHRPVEPAWLGRPRPDDSGDRPATDPGREQLQRRPGLGPPRGAAGEDEGEGLQRQRGGSDDRWPGGDASDTAGARRQGRSGGDGTDERLPVEDGEDAADPYRDGRTWFEALHGEAGPLDVEGRDDPDRCGLRDVFGPYAEAIQRWEGLVGRAAPPPRNPAGTLNPYFTEWMMGLPHGWVCDVPGVSKTAALKMIGNSVVPACAAAAYDSLLVDLV